MTLIRKHFEETKQDIEKHIIRFSSTISDTIFKTFDIILRRDMIAANEIISADEAIDREQLNIEDMCVRTIATEQPIASDLRYLVAYIKIVAVYEKIADYTKTMCRKLELTTQQLIDAYTPHILEQKKIISEMLNGTIEALIKKNGNLARDIARTDSRLDANYRKTHRQLVKNLDNAQIPHNSTLSFLTIIRTFERIGDMLSIINELTVYAVDGSHIDLN